MALVRGPMSPPVASPRTRVIGALARLCCVIVLVACTPRSVLAHALDISLRGLGRPRQQGFDDPAVRRYRALANDLVLAMTPKPLQPAETLGMSGFEFAVASTTTNIDETAAHWQGQPGAPVLEGALNDRQVPSHLWTPTIHFRKGLPLSTELGVTGTYLARSDMFMLGAEFKAALYESYFRWIPAVAARASFSRLFGSPDLDVVAGEGDLMASLPIGIMGTLQLTPYLGGGVMFANVNSGVIDETPYIVTESTDQKGGPRGSLYTFPTLSFFENRFTRIFAGLRVNVAMLEILYELDASLVESTGDQAFSHSFKFGFDV